MGGSILWLGLIYDEFYSLSVVHKEWRPGFGEHHSSPDPDNIKKLREANGAYHSLLVKEKVAIIKILRYVSPPQYESRGSELFYVRLADTHQPNYSTSIEGNMRAIGNLKENIFLGEYDVDYKLLFKVEIFSIYLAMILSVIEKNPCPLCSLYLTSRLYPTSILYSHQHSCCEFHAGSCMHICKWIQLTLIRIHSKMRHK